VEEPRVAAPGWEFCGVVRGLEYYVTRCIARIKQYRCEHLIGTSPPRLSPMSETGMPEHENLSSLRRCKLTLVVTGSIRQNAAL
jgi:hypothetical protein